MGWLKISNTLQFYVKEGLQYCRYGRYENIMIGLREGTGS